jgi:hypothetical protein
MLADRVVAMGFAESCSHETIRHVLKKRKRSPIAHPALSKAVRVQFS